MKKFASLLMAVALLATMLCVFAVPAFAEGEAESVNKPEGAEWLVDEGDNHVWYELTENDTKLIIDGEGAMPDYDLLTLESRPWANAAETVTTVQINSGITALGAYAFSYLKKLASVTIPDGVTSIGESVFEHCESLASVTIPSSVKTLGTAAFSFCKNLESVTIPFGVTSIEDNMFTGCTSLTSVTIPSSVQTIGSAAFSSCSSLTSITIPYGVKSIGNSAFVNCSSLESISFPSSITSIGKGVLQFCSNLTSITLKTKTPPTWESLTNLFKQNAKSKLYIPDGTSEDYNNGDWGDLISQEKVKEAYVVDDQPGENGTVMFDKDTFPTETYTAANETVTGERNRHRHGNARRGLSAQSGQFVCRG